MIRLIESFCKCHEIPEDKCHFIRTLRDLQAHRFADAMSEERVIPEWTSSTSSQIP
jgi:hypothetical protein